MTRRYHHVQRILIAAIAVLVMASLPAVLRAQVNLELVGSPKAPIPPDGSQWHELFPNHCAMHTQDDYMDNGDGEVSACDYINLVDAAGVVSGWHITWVGPTYTLVPCGTADDPSWHEPRDPLPGEDPTCQEWEEIWPDHGLLEHVDGWEDNGDGVLNQCDNVVVAGICYHIELVSLNIEVVPGPLPNESTTWGRIKALY